MARKKGYLTNQNQDVLLPNEVEILTAQNIVSKNLLDADNPDRCTITWTGNGISHYFTSTATWHEVVWHFKVKAGETYTFSYKARNSDYIYLYITEYTTSGIWLKTHVADGIAITNSFTIENDGILKIKFLNNLSVSNVLIEELQLEKGLVKTDYVPYRRFSFNSSSSMEKIIVDEIEGKNKFNKYGKLNEWYEWATGETFLYDNAIKATSNPCVGNGPGQFLTLKPYTTYTLSFRVLATEIAGSSYLCLIKLVPDGWGCIAKPQFSNTGYYWTTFTTSDVSTYWLSINGMANEDGTYNYVVYDEIQIEEGDTPTKYASYNHYGHNSINSLDDIVVDSISGKNLVHELNYDGLGNPNTTYNKVDNKKVIVNSNNNIWAWTQFTLDGLPINQTLTFSADLTSDGNAICNVIFYDANDNMRGRIDNTTATNKKLIMTFTTPTEKIKIRFSANNSSTELTNTATFDNIMIEKGNAATKYVPYEKFGYNDTKSMGKIVVDDIECKNLFDGLFLNGTITDFGVFEYYSTTLVTANFIKVKPNSEYIFSNNENFIIDRIICYDENGSFLGRTQINKNQYITDINTYYIKFTIYNGGENLTPSSVSGAQFEKGLIATEYVPHKEFNNKQIYSTEEHIVGTWIDNKPIYRKVLTFDTSAAAGAAAKIAVLSEVGLGDIDTLVKMDFITKDTYDGILPGNYFTSGDDGARAWLSIGYLMFMAGNIYGFGTTTFIFEYTKTTD